MRTTPLPIPPLTSLPPGTATIMTVLLPGDPPRVQLDLLSTINDKTEIVVRHIAPAGQQLEIIAAFEVLLAGTVMGKPLDPSGFTRTHTTPTEVM